jgi:hypothetical protein
LLTPKYFAVLIIVGNAYISISDPSKTLTLTPFLLKNSFNLISNLIVLGEEPT